MPTVLPAIATVAGPARAGLTPTVQVPSTRTVSRSNPLAS
jgi:hypothetical protein